eukprot:TRINITY_DN27052_c0_g1_i3.p1 TRINITY_DN27052_c0_g1~~TRINITY_DN27052_c0_g1_i3.p1  ORF type:complete len:187 (+),score=36.90 TRINITY_DN27052_c0_g1_i3:32-592(+)
MLKMPERLKPAVLGHRGAPYAAAENTLRGFAHTADVGADGVELDVWMTTDGVPVVFHGEHHIGEISCLLDGTGNIDQRSLAEVRALKFLPDEAHVPALPGAMSGACPIKRTTKPEIETVPTLLEVLRLMKDRGMRVTVELKGKGTAGPSVGAVLEICLLYTSDAADEEDSVDLGGRRNIKKKQNID